MMINPTNLPDLSNFPYTSGRSLSLAEDLGTVEVPWVLGVTPWGGEPDAEIAGP